MCFGALGCFKARQVICHFFCNLQASKGLPISKPIQMNVRLLKRLLTLESEIDVGQGITVGPGKFVKKNKHRALNKRRA